MFIRDVFGFGLGVRRRRVARRDRVAGSSYTRIVVARQGKRYRLQVRVQTTPPESKDVQVTVKLPAGGRRQPELVGRFRQEVSGVATSQE